jgi:hypothetical protein
MIDSFGKWCYLFRLFVKVTFHSMAFISDRLVSKLESLRYMLEYFWHIFTFQKGASNPCSAKIGSS